MSRRNQKPIAKPANPMKTLMRVMSYMSKNKLQLLLVVFLVLFCSGAQVLGNYYLKPIINDYIAPMIGVAPENRVYSGLIGMLVQLAIIYLVGVFSGYAYKYIMMVLSNRALNEMRRDLFNKMQDLPIKYYDTHAHGDIMSRYTNDIDTIREAMSEGFTAIVSSTVSIVGNFTMMILLSPTLSPTIRDNNKSLIRRNRVDLKDPFMPERIFTFASNAQLKFHSLCNPFMLIFLIFIIARY